ncbi:MAG: enoyl-CoA hydratase/isomerase family protein [Porticoccaceae bacterium]
MSEASSTSPSTTKSYQTLAIEHREGVDWLTLNRPDNFNALNKMMTEELLDYFGNLYFDHSVRVVVLRGAGKHFCAGLDLNDAGHFTGSVASGARGQRQVAEIIMRMRRCPQPIVALVQGAATGAGLAFSLAADVRYAAEGARMNVAMAKIGLTGCDIGISYFLPRVVGASNAAEMMMTGRFVDAQKALRIGLVSEVVPADELETAGRALAEDMTAMSPLGLRLTKEGLAMSIDAGSLEAVIAMEDRGQVMCLGPFLEEGAAAFMEKRRPNYSDE